MLQINQSYCFFTQADLKSYWSTTERGRKSEEKLIEAPYDIESWGTLVREAQVYNLHFWFHFLAKKNSLKRQKLFLFKIN